MVIGVVPDESGTTRRQRPVDELMVPGYSGFLANTVAKSDPASSVLTRTSLGGEPAHPGPLADLDNGHDFRAS